MWETFFKELGFKVKLSGDTNREILEKGVKLSENESCLSCKVFNGHIAALLDKKIDYLFIPRYRSLRRSYKSCPKFFALSDVAKIIFKDVSLILDPEINFNKEGLDKTLYKLGYNLCKSKIRAKKATKKALACLEKYQREQEKQYFQKIRSKKPKIVLISHPYNIHDSFINLDIIRKLNNLGMEVITVDSIPYKERTFYSGWDFMDEMIAQVREIITKDIKGAVQISAFNCGPDSIMLSLIEREFKKVNIPYMSLIIDEHTADAGIQTRLEAFVDTLEI